MPRLFARYIRDLVAAVVNSGTGCNIANVMFNILAYADDIVLISPPWRGLQRLLDILEVYVCSIDMVINAVKSLCMIFAPRQRSKVIADVFPLFRLGSDYLHFVENFKYLGHRR